MDKAEGNGSPPPPEYKSPKIFHGRVPPKYRTINFSWGRKKMFVFGNPPPQTRCWSERTQNQPPPVHLKSIPLSSEEDDESVSAKNQILDIQEEDNEVTLPPPLPLSPPPQPPSPVPTPPPLQIQNPSPTISPPNHHRHRHKQPPHLHKINLPYLRRRHIPFTNHQPTLHLTPCLRI